MVLILKNISERLQIKQPSSLISGLFHSKDGKKDKPNKSIKKVFKLHLFDKAQKLTSSANTTPFHDDLVYELALSMRLIQTTSIQLENKL